MVSAEVALFETGDNRVKHHAAVAYTFDAMLVDADVLVRHAHDIEMVP